MWPLSGQCSSGPRTARNTRRWFRQRREGALIAPRGTGRGPRSHREAGGKATLRRTRDSGPLAPGPRPWQHARTPPGGPAARGAGGTRPRPGEEPEPGQRPPPLRAASLPTKGRSTPLRDLERRGGSRSQALLLGVPFGDRSASPRTPFTAPGPCPVGKLWARGPAAGSAGQERLREPRGRCPFGKIIKADRSRSEKNRAGKRNSGENALPSRSPASPQEACQVPATGASTGLQPWAPGPGSSSRCPSGLGTSHGPGVAAHARRLPPRRRRADKSAK